MNIIEEAYKGLWPDKELKYDSTIRYSGRFKGFNANVRLYSNQLTFNLSKQWRPISRDIKIGLLQELMLKIMRQKDKKTKNIDLYHIFLKKVHIAIPKTRTDPLLSESFDRINEKYFYDLIEKPNLAWSKAVSKLGSYEYGTDTITISRILESNTDLLDYVMYHEVLHKKMKFHSKNSRTYHHTADFRKKEKEFPNSREMERQLSMLTAKSRVKTRAKTRPKTRAKRLFGLF